MYPLDLFESPNFPSNIIYTKGFLSPEESNILLDYFLQLPTLAQGSVTLFGKTYPTPRLEALFGDENLRYRYSNQLMQALPLCPTLLHLKERVESATHAHFNCVLVNLYRNGMDSNGWHADNEPELGNDPIIASLSFGASRMFQLKSLTTQERITIPLHHGDLLLMGSGIQRSWKHCIPKAPKIGEPRVNLTFRKIVT